MFTPNQPCQFEKIPNQSQTEAPIKLSGQFPRTSRIERDAYVRERERCISSNEVVASLVIEVAAAMGWWCGEKESEMREEDGEKRSIVVMVQQWRCVVAVERGDENAEVGGTGRDGIGDLD
jgi:hypothetical protein|uniref:Uncharacterized protein n=1 Tax=Fagus sylvatica TaxID=28930 RepID=A0A2N9IWA4_FAGSY